MKIAIIADPLDNQNAGVHYYTKALVTGLVKNLKSNRLVLFRQFKDSELLNAEQIAIPNIKLPIGFASLRLFFIIPFLIMRKDINIVIEPAHFGPFNLPRRIKRVTVIHDLTPLKFPQHHRWHSQILQRIFLKRILKKADLIITNSKNTSKDLEEYFPFTAAKNQSILLGKDSIYKPNSDPGRIADLGLTKPYFLSVGTIEPRKNLVRLLNAFERFVEKESKEVQLVFVGGKGWKNQEFEKRIKSFKYKSRIKFLGYVERTLLPIIYTHSISLVYPSLYEGFGLPVLEAMACGTPVICSNTSSLPEVGGKAAYYINPESEMEIFKTMQTIFHLSEEERNQLNAVCIAQASKFSWDQFTEEWTDCLSKL